MEQFSPEKSKIFQAAAFANFYSSPPLVVARAALAVSLGYLFINASMSNSLNLLFLALAPSIIFFVFEIYYRAKILHERPISLKIEKDTNLANSFSFDAARIILKNQKVSSLNHLLNALLKDKEVSFAFYRADVTGEDLKIISKAKSEEVNWPDVVSVSAGWAEKEKRK